MCQKRFLNKNKTITQAKAKTNNTVVVSDKILKINNDFFIVVPMSITKKKLPRRVSEFHAGIYSERVFFFNKVYDSGLIKYTGRFGE